ncbi:hypothetical protein [Humibacter ginsenosidimutans]|uniref:hypothetical protein n=1 Tax=Humibacter ginsenosidimutans TaxID=2599293 RepID=UPI001FF023F1|nr:hypothetical protein [Humibacter ginsenosidimutans]
MFAVPSVVPPGRRLAAGEAGAVRGPLRRVRASTAVTSAIAASAMPAIPMPSATASVLDAPCAFGVAVVVLLTMVGVELLGGASSM